MNDSSSLEAIFFAALEKGSPQERADYLDTACAGNPDLRRRVEKMLVAKAELSSFLEQPAFLAETIEAHRLVSEGDPPVHSGDQRGEMIGPYKLLEQIGEGGMGSVWMAQQSEPMKRLVALKLVKAGMDTRQVIARFEAERQALALMDHANIARVLDAGTSSSGRPYFVMELVKGVPITRYCDQHHLTPKQRLDLFIPICQAIQHAHQKGIIHRDLKPSNVLVALYDGKPIPKVIDFGVAKATGQSLTEKTLVTGFGSIVGTLEYMSPEQAEFNQLDIDTRSDIYSLGVMLYELLAGSPPFNSKELEKAGILEMLRMIREQEPSKPSTKLISSEALPSLSASRGMEPAKLTSQIRGDLDWIVMKALEKDRNRRYETADSLALDLQRFLADEPVMAHPPSTSYRLRKFVSKNRVAVFLSLFAVTCALAAIVNQFIASNRVRDERDRALLAAEAEKKATQAAEVEKKRAEDAEAQTLASYRASTDEAIEQLIGSKPELGSKEKTYLENSLQRWQEFAARQGDDERSRAIRAEGHYRVAYLWQKLGRSNEAVREYETARDLRKNLVADFRDVPQYQRELAASHNGLGVQLIDLGRRDAARIEYESARDLQAKLVEAFPTVPDYQRELATTRNNLGILLFDLGQHGPARAEYETARDLQIKLRDSFPDVSHYQQELARTHNSLGNLLLGLGRRDEARTEYETACELQRKLVETHRNVPQFQTALANTHNSLGIVLLELGQADEARTEYETARDLQLKLTADFPAVPQYQQDLASTHYSLGILLADQGQGDAARTEYESARNLRSKLVAVYPAVPQYQWDLAAANNVMGALIADLGDFNSSRAYFETARDLFKKLVADFPAVPRYQQELAATHNNLGVLLLSLGEYNAAQTEWETALELQKNLVDTFPSVPRYKIELGGAYKNFAILIRETGKPSDSLPWFDLAIRTLTPLYDQDHRQVTAGSFLRNGHMGRAEAYDLLKQYHNALKDWDRVIQLSPESEKSTYRVSRILSRLNAGQVAEGVAELEDLTKSSNGSADQWYNYACVMAIASDKVTDQKQSYADRAMELLRQAVEAGFSDAAHMVEDPDLAALRNREDFKELVASLTVVAQPLPD